MPCESSVNLAKDVVIPLIGPLISLGVAIFVFWWGPKRQRERQLALDLHEIYNSSEMQRNRIEAWAYLHGELDRRIVDERFDKVIRWTTAFPPAADLASDAVKLQQILKVFSFFATCEDCLRERLVDPKLLRTLLGYSFLRWSVDTIDAVRVRAPASNDLAAVNLPGWFAGMPLLKELCGIPMPARLDARARKRASPVIS